MLKVLKKLLPSVFRNLFMISIFLFAFFIFFSPIKLFALNASDVATVDIYLVTALHPRMALFDYSRLGFYKVDFGLNYNEFIAKINDLKVKSNNSNAISVLEKELEKIKQESIKYQRENIDDFKNRANYAKKMSEFAKDKEDILNKIDILNWEFKNSDLTTREETKAILLSIKREIYETIKKLVETEKISLVMNTSLFVPYSFYDKTVELIGYQGIPGINFDVYQAFDKIKYQVDLKKSDYDSFFVQRWTELTENKKEKLPISNYPMVLSGGKSITSEVIKILYEKYKVTPQYTDLVLSVIDRIEVLQFGKKIEKLEVLEKD